MQTLERRERRHGRPRANRAVSPPSLAAAALMARMEPSSSPRFSPDFVPLTPRRRTPSPTPDELHQRGAARIERAVDLAKSRREEAHADGIAGAKAAARERARRGRFWREKLPETVQRRLQPPKEYDDDEAERDARKTARLGEHRRRFSELSASLSRDCRELDRSLIRQDYREKLAGRNMKLPFERIDALVGAYTATAEDVTEARVPTARCPERRRRWRKVEAQGGARGDNYGKVARRQVFPRVSRGGGRCGSTAERRRDCAPPPWRCIVVVGFFRV